MTDIVAITEVLLLGLKYFFISELNPPFYHKFYIFIISYLEFNTYYFLLYTLDFLLPHICMSIIFMLKYWKYLALTQYVFGGSIMSHRQYSINDRRQQDEENLLYLTVSSYDGNWQSIPHTHSFCEFFYITDGEGYFSLNDQRYPVRKNHFIVVNPHIVHTESTKENQSLSYIVLGIENLEFEFEKTDDAGYSHCIFDFSKPTNEIRSILNLMVEETRKKRSDYQEILGHYLKALLLKIKRTTNYKSHSLPSSVISSDCLYLKKYITENYSQNITLDSLATLMHRNKFYISHAFSKAFGISPMHYLNEIRIIVAKSLLTTSDFSIQQVAEMVGFSSATYFSQTFKKNTGLSPRDFRIQTTTTN